MTNFELLSGTLIYWFPQNSLWKSLALHWKSPDLRNYYMYKHLKGGWVLILLSYKLMTKSLHIILWYSVSKQGSVIEHTIRTHMLSKLKPQPQSLLFSWNRLTAILLSTCNIIYTLTVMTQRILLTLLNYCTGNSFTAEIEITLEN